jgi:histidinol dehydrogenase
MESKMQALFFIGITRLKVLDYASGTNHTLPTNGYAKGVNLDSFTKSMTFQKISEVELKYWKSD